MISQWNIELFIACILIRERAYLLAYTYAYADRESNLDNVLQFYILIGMQHAHIASHVYALFPRLQATHCNVKTKITCYHTNKLKLWNRIYPFQDYRGKRKVTWSVPNDTANVFHHLQRWRRACEIEIKKARHVYDGGSYGSRLGKLSLVCDCWNHRERNIMKEVQRVFSSGATLFFIIARSSGIICMEKVLRINNWIVRNHIEYIWSKYTEYQIKMKLIQLLVLTLSGQL